MDDTWLEGLSSDVYVYDSQRETIRRLTDGPEQIQSISWSPNGNWIVHSSANDIGQGIPGHYFAVARDWAFQTG
jgi:hypothetical protein